MGYQQWLLRLSLLFLVGGAFAPVARAQLPLNSTSTLYAYCVDQYGYIVYYCNVTISNGYSNCSGGHQHEDFAKPYSTVSPTYGNTGYWGLPLAVTTDEVGGVEYIDVCATFCSRSYFAVGVGGLYTLPFGQQTYVNIGWTSIHPWGNHYGTLNTVYGVQDTASQYHAEFPQHPIIAINDLSLVYGGLFDVGLSKWSPPHETHRYGTSVDIRGNGTANSVPRIPFVQERFRQICTENGAIWTLHGDPDTDNEHFHCEWGS